MKLKQNQLNLIKHLAQFEALEYKSCLRILDTEKTNNQTALSYTFCPLTKNNYLVKHKDGMVNILTKGRNLFSDIVPLVTLGGGAASVKRINMVSRTAMFLKEAGIESVASPDTNKYKCFVPSACWRKIRLRILSTTRFSGILFIGNHRIAVYDIGDGTMEWQLRAERSLFYQNYSDYETKATGMLLICDDDKREKIAENIIRVTMWHRKNLIGREVLSERTRPVKYVQAPIRIAWYYEHVYLITPNLLSSTLKNIMMEEKYIKGVQGDSPKCFERKDGDYEAWPERFFVNISSDLLKYVYLFSAIKTDMTMLV